GSVAHVPAYLKRVKAGEAQLMGFGHRVYRNFDPRGRVIKRLAQQVLAVMGPNRLLDVALELERIALEDDYFVERKLYPNVEFYSGIIYQAMGFPVDMFPVLFAIARTAGWIAQWLEMVQDEEQKIARPRQLTDRPFGVNLLLYFPVEDQVAVCLEERVPVLSLFWGDPAPYVARAHAAGVTVMHQVGSVAAARRAAAAGVDIIVAQGVEAGGHVEGKVGTMVLVPRVVDAVAPTPVAAAGGIA